MRITLKTDRPDRTALLLTGLVCAWAMWQMPGPRGAAAQGKDSFESYRTREKITVGSVVRDFRPAWLSGGHPDFVRAASGGAGRYARIAADGLDASGKPVLATTGHRLLTDWTDGKGRPVISTKPYITARPGDAAGSVSPAAGGAVSSGAAFAQWFRDLPGLNQTRRSEITLAYEPSGSVYAFDGSLDTAFSGSPDYTYTYELEIPFVYEQGKGWYFATATNADVWVYVDGQLVIDAGSGLGPVSALAVDGTIKMSNTASVSGPAGSAVAMSTNSTAAGAVELKNASKVTGDVLAGPGANPGTAITGIASAVTGARGALPTAVPMPAVSAPTGLGAGVGDRIYSGGTHTVATSFLAKTVRLDGVTTLNIQGDVVIHAEEMFDAGNASTVNLMPGATLTIYVGKDFYLHNGAKINVNTGDPSRVLLVNLGASTVLMDNGGEFVGRILSPMGEVRLGNDITVTGAILARSAELVNNGKLIGVGNVSDLLYGPQQVGLQWIDFDRLGWLSEGRTHTLHVFFANRLNAASHLRLETNMVLLNLAVVPAATYTD